MNIGIYIYDQAEVLDFSGPFEVFSTAKRLGALDWQVSLIAEQPGVVKARGHYLIEPHYHIDNHPPLDLLIVVGGDHSQEMHKTAVLEWLARIAPDTPQVASVCTGAFLLANAGLLDGLTVTTHWEDIDALKAFSALNVVDDKRFVEQGKWTTSAGISAGIDMSLHLVAKLVSQELAEKTARQMDYRWIQTP
ncbi:DJ-1/PfpI family protein [Vibrio xiamenensis]|uniref:DJ-1/PfpI family protein n=1 Tax=Vibrio xiamenensis TaxID=861298 RepID=A0A1G8G7B1_9VIBR|nr:DJ-1/PfpI family protein [Vibrio xiamenensis]SDH90304.1 DJ-1/PfpI family protein [Vibrio xiamenensis]